MKTLAYCLVACLALPALGQTVDPFSEAYARYLMGTLAADSLEGRDPLRPSIEKATRFLEAEMKAIGLDFLPGTHSYRHPVTLWRLMPPSPERIVLTVTAPGAAPQTLSALAVVASPQKDPFVLGGRVGAGQDVVYRQVDQEAVLHIMQGNDTTSAALQLIGVSDTSLLQGILDYLQWEQFVTELPETAAKQRLYVVLDSLPQVLAPGTEVRLTYTPAYKAIQAYNVIGQLTGSSQPETQVILGGHYDHVGVGRPNAEGDSIYNGANDDASGTAAVLMLARHYAALPTRPARTVVFGCWTGEELGLLGSSYFAKQVQPESVAAMLNLEMMGQPWKYGPGSVYITGYAHSNLGALLQAHAPADSTFRLYPDPYTAMQLFFRSDNLGFARLGIPAHTLCTADMDRPGSVFYHMPDDEIENMDLKAFAQMVQGIGAALWPLLDGQLTPNRLPQAVVDQLR